MKTVPVTIPNGQSLSAPIILGGLNIVGIVMPSIWTSANLTFQASLLGQTWANLFNTLGTEVMASPLANQHITINSLFFGFENDTSPLTTLQIRLRSGTSASPVNQAQDSTLILLLQ